MVGLKITRPTRFSDDANTLIDNILSNNIYGSHTVGSITTPISDHLMNFLLYFRIQFYIYFSRTQFREVEQIIQHSINNDIYINIDIDILTQYTLYANRFNVLSKQYKYTLTMTKNTFQ